MKSLRKRRKNKGRGLQLERLEDRRLLAVGGFFIDLTRAGDVDLFGADGGGAIHRGFQNAGVGLGINVSTRNVPGVNNLPPEAGADAVTVEEDSAVIITETVLANDSDPDAGDELTITAVGSATGSTSVASGVLTYDPNGKFESLGPGEVATDVFTYTVSDHANANATGTVTVTVTGVNDAPTFTAGADQTVNEDAGEQTVTGWATEIHDGDGGTQQGLTFGVTGNTNESLFAVAPAIDPSGNLTYTPADNASGSATVTVSLQDDGGTANGGSDTSASHSLTITVNSVNDVPSFSLSTNAEELDENGGALSFPGFAVSISVGPDDESGQAPTFLVSNSNPSLFAAGPSIDSAGTISVTTADEADGTAVLTISLMDDGGTDNGGVNTSAEQTFTLTVKEVNEAPTLASIGNQTIDESTELAFTATATDPDLPANDLTFELSGAPDGASISSDGEVSWTPTEADGPGTFTFDVIVRDNATDELTDSETITVTVEEVNRDPDVPDPGPTFTATGNVTIDVDAESGLLKDVTDADVTDGDTQQALAVSAGTTSDQGGALEVDTDGSFTYTSAPGFQGTDTFDYTVTDGISSVTETATITVSDTIWFIDKQADAGGDGTLAAPFNSFDPLNDDGNDPDESGDVIFAVKSDTESYDIDHADGFTLEQGQSLLGENLLDGNDEVYASLDAFLSAELSITVAPHSDTLPDLGPEPTGIRNSQHHVVVVEGDNYINGVDLDPVASAGIFGENVANLTIVNVTITTSGGTNNNEGIDLAGATGQLSFVGLSIGTADGGVNAGAAIRIVGGDATFEFDDVTIEQTAPDEDGGDDPPAGLFTAIVIQGDDSGSPTVNFNDVDVNQTGGGLISIANAARAVQFDEFSELNLTGGTRPGVEVTNEDEAPGGNITLDAVLDIVTTAVGVVVENAETIAITAAQNRVVSDGAPAIQVVGTNLGSGGLNFNEVESTNSPTSGINFEGVGGDGDFNVTIVNITGSAQDGVRLVAEDDEENPDTPTPSLNIGGGNISRADGATGSAITIIGGSGNVDIGANIANQSGNAIIIEGRHGGEVDVTGQINQAGDSAGIVFRDNTGGTANFEAATIIQAALAPIFELLDNDGFEAVVNGNQPPRFHLQRLDVIAVGAGPQSVADFASEIDAGRGDDDQTVTFNILDNSNPNLFAADDDGNPLVALADDGTLTYTPADGAVGIATIWVEAVDDGGTEDGGIDTSGSRRFTIAIDDHADVYDESPTEITLDVDGNGDDTGELQFPLDLDTFEVTVDSSGILVVEATSDDVDTFLTVVDEDGDLVAINDDFGQSTGSRVAFGVEPGNYFPTVEAYGPFEFGAFEIDLQLVDASDDHVNATGADATPLELDSDGRASVDATLEVAGDVDVFQTTTDDPGTVTISVVGDDPLDTFLLVFNDDHEIIAANDDRADDSTDSEITVPVDPGTYYFAAGASANDQTGDFSLAVDFDSTVSFANYGAQLMFIRGNHGGDDLVLAEVDAWLDDLAVSDATIIQAKLPNTETFVELEGGYGSGWLDAFPAPDELVDDFMQRMGGEYEFRVDYENDGEFDEEFSFSVDLAGISFESFPATPAIANPGQNAELAAGERDVNLEWTATEGDFVAVGVNINETGSILDSTPYFQGEQTLVDDALNAPLLPTGVDLIATVGVFDEQHERASGDGEVRFFLASFDLTDFSIVPETVAVASGNSTGAFGGGSAEVGGIDFDFTNAGAAASFSGEYFVASDFDTQAFVLGGYDALDAAYEAFEIASLDNLQAWDLDLTNEGGDVGFDSTELTFAYDDTLIGVPWKSLAEVEAGLRIHHWDGAEWDQPTVLDLDTDANTITIEATSFSPFVLGGPPIGEPDNTAPVLDAIGNRNVDAGQLLTFTASATDDDGDDLVFGLDNAPAGASLDPVSGVFTWTPTVAQVGSHSFDVVVVDNGTPSVEDSESITVTVRPDGASDDQPFAFFEGALERAHLPDGGILTFAYLDVELTDDGRWTPDMELHIKRPGGEFEQQPTGWSAVYLDTEIEEGQSLADFIASLAGDYVIGIDYDGGTDGNSDFDESFTITLDTSGLDDASFPPVPAINAPTHGTVLTGTRSTTIEWDPIADVDFYFVGVNDFVDVDAAPSDTELATNFLPTDTELLAFVGAVEGHDRTALAEDDPVVEHLFFMTTYSGVNFSVESEVTAVAQGNSEGTHAGGAGTLGGLDYAVVAATQDASLLADYYATDSYEGAAVLLGGDGVIQDYFSNVEITGNTFQIWDLELTDATDADVDVVYVDLTLPYDQTVFGQDWSSLTSEQIEQNIYAYQYDATDCVWEPVRLLARDTEANTITVRIDAMSPLVLGHDPDGPGVQPADDEPLADVHFEVFHAELDGETLFGASVDLRTDDVRAEEATTMNFRGPLDSDFQVLTGGWGWMSTFYDPAEGQSLGDFLNSLEGDYELQFDFDGDGTHEESFLFNLDTEGFDLTDFTSAPTITSPAEGATLPSTDRMPTISWDAVDDADFMIVDVQAIEPDGIPLEAWIFREEVPATTTSVVSELLPTGVDYFVPVGAAKLLDDVPVQLGGTERAQVDFVLAHFAPRSFSIDRAQSAVPAGDSSGTTGGGSVAVGGVDYSLAGVADGGGNFRAEYQPIGPNQDSMAVVYGSQQAVQDSFGVFYPSGDDHEGWRINLVDGDGAPVDATGLDVTLRYDPSLFGEWASEEDLRAFQYDHTAGEWTQPTIADRDTDLDTITVQTTNVSSIVLGIAADPLRAENGQGPGASVLTMDELSPIVDEAINRLKASGLDDALVCTLETTHIEIRDLADGLLGSSAGNSILIDIDGAGHGWYIDPTPGDDSEFSGPANTELGQVDLLTVVMHEMGHVLGLDHDTSAIDDLMAETLPTNTRRLPTVSPTELDDDLLSLLATDRR